MKKRFIGFISLLSLILAYFVFRYPLFELHRMKQWPLVLFIVGIIVVLISGLIMQNKVLPVFTVVGYIAGFIVGYFFQRDYGIGLNSMWMIWSCCYVACIVVGEIISLFGKRKRQSYTPIC